MNYEVGVVHCLAEADQNVEDVRVVVEHSAALHIRVELRLTLRVQRLQIHCEAPTLTIASCNSSPDKSLPRTQTCTPGEL